MRKKDIITLSIAAVVIVVCVYFAFQLLFPSKKQPEETTTQKSSIKVVPKEIDEKTFHTISTLSDYGGPALEGIGKSDLFGGI